MLKKCLKYDLKSVFKIWALLAVTVLALSPFAGLCLRSLLLRLDTLLFPWEVFVLMGGVFLLSAFLIVTMLMVYIRFYTNFFKDEGYLTFTLPVSRKTLFLSKLLNAVIYDLASMAVIVLAIAVTLLIAPDLSGEHYNLLGSTLSFIAAALAAMIRELGFFAILLILEAVLLVLLSSLTKPLFYYFAITLGTSFTRKHPILITIALIYAVNSLAPMLGYACTFALSLWGGSAATLYPLAFTGGTGTALLLILGAILCLIVAIADLLLWSISLGNIERKLNLA